MARTQILLSLFLTACSGSLVSEPGKVSDSSDTSDSGSSGGCAAVDLDCAGVCFGSSLVDMCGVCDDDPANDCAQDCAGTWGGVAMLDDCGVCAGGDSGCASCPSSWARPPAYDNYDDYDDDDDDYDDYD